LRLAPSRKQLIRLLYLATEAADVGPNGEPQPLALHL
jgi:hypothetical protein